MGNLIKQFRLARGLTQEQLGKLVDVKKAAVCKWEDDIAPSPSSAIRLEEVSQGVLARWMLRPDLWEPPSDGLPFRGEIEAPQAPASVEGDNGQTIMRAR